MLFVIFCSFSAITKLIIDIIVALSPNARLGLGFFEMICDLEDRLNRPVDMVREGQLLPFASESANRDKILVYERKS